MRTSGKPKSSAASKDLVIICLGSLVVFVLAIRFEVYERFAAWAALHDDWLVDDVVVVLILLGFAAGIFSWRRLRELKIQVDRRETAESLLLKNEESYRHIVEQASEIIYRTDSAGLFTFCNAATARLLNYSEEELLGLNYLDVVSPDYRPAVERFYHQQVTDLTASTYYEFPAVSKGGKEILLGQNVQLVTDNGRVAGFQAVARDMTERQRSEDAMRQMEEYRNLFKLANDPILILDAADGTVLDVNDKACETYGYSRDQFVGRSLLSLTQDPALAEQRMETARKEGKLEQFETTHLSASGVPLHFLINPSAVQYQGQPALLTVNRDLTEDRRAQEEQNKLQRERDQLLEQLQLQMEFMPTAFQIMDANFRTTSWNPAAERIFGFTREEVLGTFAHKLIVPTDSLAHVEGIFERIASGEEMSISVNENITRDGRRISCEWYNAPLKTADGTFVGIMCMAQDVTERKLAEQSLQEANKRALTDYDRLVERIATLGQTLGNARDLTTIFRALRDFAEVSTPCDGVVISLYDPEKQTRRASYCWTDKTEFDPKDMVDVPVRDGMTGRAIKSGTVIIDNNYLQHMTCMADPVLVGDFSDDRLPRSALVAPMTVMGRTVGCIEVQSYQECAYGQEHTSAMRMAANLAATAVENVSLIKREQAKERQLRQALKMEAIGQLAGGIAHDFNNILAAIIGNCELALMDSSVENPFDHRLKEVLKASNRAKDLVRQILTFSRREEHELEPLKLPSIIDEVLQLLRSSLPSSIEIRQNIDAMAPAILGNATQMHQVIMNLGTNASQAMGAQGGVLEVSLNTVEIDVEFAEAHPGLQPGAHIRLVVSDSGCGMNQATAERIFEPFFTTKPQGSGTGLGLAVVHGIVKSHGGAISVYSEASMGTTFTLHLPVYSRPATELPHRSTVVPPGNGEHVLFVDDEESLASLGKAMLERLGYRVTTEISSIEALKVFRSRPHDFQLVITDQTMPHMSGVELARVMRGIRPDLPVILATGFSTKINAEQAQAIGIQELLLKPNTAQSLGEAIRRALKSNSKD
jgi:PAS domain S-box-containing protein